MGVSTVIEDLSQINILYNEALAALKAKNPKKHIYYFEDLEIEGVLFQIKDEILIDRFVAQQLGELLELDKDYDLTKHFILILKMVLILIKLQKFFPCL